MLYGKEVLKHLCGKRLRLGLAALGGLVLVTIVTAGATHGDLSLSKQDMKNIVGGQGGKYSECDDCRFESATLDECYHTLIEEFAECKYGGCCHWVFYSATCSPNQGDGAEGCDTLYSYPSTPAATGYIYADDECPEDPWTEGHIWATIYFGCDTCAFTCDIAPQIGYCEKSWECQGQYLGTEDGPEDQFECGC